MIGEARRLSVFGVEIDVVTLPMLIRLKRAAGRPKDLEAIAELELLRDEGAQYAARRRDRYQPMARPSFRGSEPPSIAPVAWSIMMAW